MATAFPKTSVKVPSMVGTTTVVFGGSNGMGKATSAAILNLGGRVVLVSRNAARLAAASEHLVAQTDCDVAAVDCASVDALSEASVAEFFAKYEPGSINHLVVTLGPAVEGADDIFGAATLGKVQQQFGKFNAAWLAAKFGAPKLADGGSITLFSGTLATAISKNSSCLAPANAAVECLAKCLAKDLGPRLRVNCVSPTLTRTTAVTGGMTEEQAEAMFTGFGRTLPAGRAGEAEDCGHAVACLINNNFITGQVLAVDGGKTL